MAVVATKSTRVSNSDAVPSIMDSVQVNHGRRRSIAATIEIASGDSIGSTYRMARVHSSWRIESITLFCDAITSGAADIGLYHIAARSSGAVVDADAYASAVSIATAITAGSNVAFEARDIANVAKSVFEDAGLTADHGYWYDLTLTLTAAAAAAGTVSVQIGYVAND